MLQSLRYSQLFLRFSLAFVFIWFGVGKFINPEYWINAWMFNWDTQGLMGLGISRSTLLSAIAIFELLVGISLVSGMFIRPFCLLAIIFLIFILVTFRFSETVVRDIGLIGGLGALLLWPERKSLTAWE